VVKLTPGVNQKQANALRACVLAQLSTLLTVGLSCNRSDLGLLAAAAVVFGAGQLVPPYTDSYETWYTKLRKPECAQSRLPLQPCPDVVSLLHKARPARHYGAY
jgi:hypothetical protein